MDDEEKYSPKRFKPSRSEGEEEECIEVSVIQPRRQNQDLDLSEEQQSSDHYCRKGPSLSENSINNILKVVSLQSFSSSPRLATSSSEGLNGCQRTRSYDSRSNGSDSPPTRSNGESSPSSEDSGSSFPPALDIPSRNSSRKSSSRGKRGEKANNVLKDEKYWEKRVRNNASAKRSRDARRVRELECQIRSEFMEDENRKLEHENKLLREENMRLLKIIDELKSRD